MDVNFPLFSLPFEEINGFVFPQTIFLERLSPSPILLNWSFESRFYLRSYIQDWIRPSLELRTLNCVVDSKYLKYLKYFKYFILKKVCCDLKAFTILNKVWTRVKGPILGLLLLLSVISLLSDNSEPIMSALPTIMDI